MRFIAAIFVGALIVIGGIMVVTSLQSYTPHAQTLFSISLFMVMVGMTGFGALLTKRNS